MSNNSQLVGDDCNELDTNIMGGCITVIVHGDNATRAQHCAGGFGALDPFILHGLRPVRIIVIVARSFEGSDRKEVNNRVRDNKGEGKASWVNSRHAACRRLGFRASSE
jgi:hypothetical protein